MIAVVGTLAWEFQVSLPLMASQVFGGGAAAYGVMASVMGVGRGGGRPGLGGQGAAERPPRSACPRSAGGSRSCVAAVAPHDAARAGGAASSSGTARITFNSMAKTVLQLAATPDDARPGDGAVGTGLARLDPDRRLRSSAGSARTRAPAGRSWSAVWLRSFAACSPSRPSPASTAAVPPRIAFHDHEETHAPAC